MTAFGKLIRTTAFRLTLVYLLLFALFAASLLVYFAWNTRRLITEQITTTVNAEIGELSDIYARRGLRGTFDGLPCPQRGASALDWGPMLPGSSFTNDCPAFSPAAGGLS